MEFSEFKAGNAARAKAIFAAQGYLIVRGFLPRETIAGLRQKAQHAYARGLLEAQDGAPLRTVVNPAFLVRRLEPEIFGQPFFCDPALLRFAREVLGTSNHYMPLAEYAFNRGDLDGSADQHIHRDFTPMRAKRGRMPPFPSLCLTLPLVPTGPRNGMLRLWPGTHVLHDSRILFMDDLSDRVQGMRGLQPRLNPGDLLIRDPRLIHRGIANRSKGIRPWIASMWIHPAISFRNKIEIPRFRYRALPVGIQKQLRYAKFTRD